MSSSEHVGKALNWIQFGFAAKPLLEWMASNESVVGSERAENARRCLVKMYLAATPQHPGIVKTRAS